MRWWLGRDCFAVKRCVLRQDEEWFGEEVPPMALWIPKNDGLVDGLAVSRKLAEERNVRVLWDKAIDGYEHLDVVWAVDAVEKVGREVARVVKGVVEESGEVIRDLDCEWRKTKGLADSCGICQQRF